MTLMVVAWSMLVWETPASVVGARLFGGPTEGATRLSWRVEVVQRTQGIERPWTGALRVEAEHGGTHRATWEGTADNMGEADVVLRYGHQPVSGPVKVRIAAAVSGRELASGRVSLAPETWQKRARRRGGWIEQRSQDGLVVRVAPASGVLAVPFAASLWIAVEDGQGPIAGAHLALLPEGMRMVPPDAGPAEWETDIHGHVPITVVPHEHIVALGVKVDTVDGRTAHWQSTLPVVPGALHASLRQGKLQVRSGIPLERAYWAVLTLRTRWSGGAVSLAPDGHGGAIALLNLPDLPAEPWWAAVSRDRDLDSPGTVGWPLGVNLSVGDEAPESFVAADRLLLDGVHGRRVAQTRWTRRVLGITVFFVALALALTTLLLLQRVSAARRTLASHWAVQDSIECPDASKLVRSSFDTSVALLCVLIGFVLIALLAMSPIGCPVSEYAKNVFGAGYPLDGGADTATLAGDE
ncbi:hypothetical protein ACFL5O_03200 [Myxococcota bacterium]